LEREKTIPRAQDFSCSIYLAAAATSAVGRGSDHEDVVVAAAALRVAAAAGVVLPDVVVVVNIDSLARRVGYDGTPGGCVADTGQVALAVVVVVAVAAAAAVGGGRDNVESPSELQRG